MSVKSKLDELINWYEQFAPEKGKQITVAATTSTCRKFAKPPVKGGPLLYKGRIIIPGRKPMKDRDNWA